LAQPPKTPSRILEGAPVRREILNLLHSERGVPAAVLFLLAKEQIAIRPKS
jgi:hypothetical protein